MTLTWDISFLLDTQGKIEEARGNCLEILGEPVRTMVGRSFLPFIAGADRAHFRRFLAQLGSANAVRRAMLHLRTSLRGDRPFFMEAQNGWSAAHYWIMLAVPTEQVTANPLAVLDAPIPTTSDDDLLMLIELAAEQAMALDLTVFSVGGLAKPVANPNADATADQGAERESQLRRQVERSLVANAYDGIVSRSEPGVYSVLHDAQKGADQIAGDLRAGAREIGLSDEEFGLSQRTVKLGLRPDRERIKAAVVAVRTAVQDRSLPAGTSADTAAPISRSPWFYLVLGALVLFLLGLGAGFLILR
ncbi:MAG TPA: PAS domain-containing protein [Dongiaceae bacterium]|nr:PAS domain-containing protein [Dongiaceae bacterium]